MVYIDKQLLVNNKITDLISQNRPVTSTIFLWLQALSICSPLPQPSIIPDQTFFRFLFSMHIWNIDPSFRHYSRQMFICSEAMLLIKEIYKNEDELSIYCNNLISSCICYARYYRCISQYCYLVQYFMKYWCEAEAFLSAPPFPNSCH